MQQKPGKAQRSLSEQTSRGVAWMSAQTVVAKVVGVVSQLVLTKILLPDEFGVYALALTVYSLALYVYQGGIQEVLIKRQRKFHLWVNPAFWLSIAFAVVSYVSIVALSPAAARFYGTTNPKQLCQMIALMGLCLPITAITFPSRARLQIGLRFKTLAFLESTRTLIDAVLKVMFACAGFGVFSFVWSTIVATILFSVAVWKVAPVKTRWNPQLRRWKYLIGDGSKVIGAALFAWMIANCDYIVLGRSESPAAVGIYFFAFSLSQQTMKLMAFQLSRVLFAALSRIDSSESERQTKAFVRAARLLAMIVVPLCLLQAAIARPMVTVLFATDEWMAAIPLIQIMCLGMAIATLQGPAASLLQAQGRFGTQMSLNILALAMYIPATIVGVAVGRSLGLAVAVAICFSLITLINLVVALLPSGNVIQSLSKIYSVPLIGSVLTIGSAFAVAELVTWPGGPRTVATIQMIVILAISGIGYLLFWRKFAPDQWDAMRRRVTDLLPNRA